MTLFLWISQESLHLKYLGKFLRYLQNMNVLSHYVIKSIQFATFYRSEKNLNG